jgi:hypothetical protein
MKLPTNYVKVTLPDGTTKALNPASGAAQGANQPSEHVPEMWSNCKASYKGFETSVRSRKFNGQVKVEILYNGSWVNLATSVSPNLSALIVNFYDNNIGVKP